MNQYPSSSEYKSDRELISNLLGAPGKAEDIVAKFGLQELLDAHQQELCLTDRQFQRLSAALELGRRIAEGRGEYKSVCRITSSTDAIEYCRSKFQRLIHEAVQEEFHIVTLNTKNAVIATHQITIGTLDSSLVHPREVFRKAIKDVSSSIILAHNHPSGDPEPSKEDIAVTARLEESGKVIGIDVLDHIVMGKDGCISIREHTG